MTRDNSNYLKHITSTPYKKIITEEINALKEATENIKILVVNDGDKARIASWFHTKYDISKDNITIVNIDGHFTEGRVKGFKQYNNIGDIPQDDFYDLILANFKTFTYGCTASNKSSEIVYNILVLLRNHLLNDSKMYLTFSYTGNNKMLLGDIRYLHLYFKAEMTRILESFSELGHNIKYKISVDSEPVYVKGGTKRWFFEIQLDNYENREKKFQTNPEIFRLFPYELINKSNVSRAKYRIKLDESNEENDDDYKTEESESEYEEDEYILDDEESDESNEENDSDSTFEMSSFDSIEFDRELEYLTRSKNSKSKRGLKRKR